MEKNIWNSKPVGYSSELEYKDFVTTSKDATVVKFEKPINEGERPGWSFKNLVTKDVGSNNVYVAWIHFDPAGGHDYHAHSSDEIIHLLEGEVQFTFSSKSGADERSMMKKGDSAFVPAGTPHSVWNTGNVQCEFIVIKCPPYFLEEIPLPEDLKNKRLMKQL